MEDFIELRRVVDAIQRRWWLLILLAALGATSGYLLSQRQKRVYQATTTLLVGQIFQTTNLNRQDILTSDLVASTYADMIRRQPVLQGAVDALGLNESWQKLKSQVQVEQVDGTQLIQISVDADSPKLAQIIADEVVHQTILFDPGGSNANNAENVRLFLQQHVQDLQSRIANGQNKLASLENEMEATDSADRLNQLQTQANSLIGLITDWENNYTQLLSYLNTGQAPNTLTIIEPAQASSNPVRPSVKLFILIGGMLGIFAALGLIFLLNFLDDTLKDPEEITHHLGIPVMGSIATTPKFNKSKNGIYVSAHPRSTVAEAYRSLRANLEFAGNEKPLKSILITSCDTDEGKSSVAANLAAILAQSSKKVTLLDADLRKPGIHELMSLSNEIGLSNVIQNELDVSQASQVLEAEKICVMTSGALPPNPSELLSSNKMGEILNELNKDSDVVIIDSPPFVVSDALLLAAKVDGVLLVVRPGITRRKNIQVIIEHLNRTGTRVVGVVMNHVPRKQGGYFGAYQPRSPYYLDNYSARIEELEFGGQMPVVRKVRAFVSENWARFTNLSVFTRL